MYANGVVPGIQDKLRRVRTNYFTTQKDVPFVSGTASYRIPTRAQHGLIALVQRLATTGELKPLTKWHERDLANHNPTTPGTPTNYLWRSNSIVLWPVPDNSSESLRFTYHRRVNKLVAVSAVGPITSVANNYLTLTMSATAASLGITTSTPVDFIKGDSPFDSLRDSVTPNAVIVSSLQFPAGTILPEMNDGTSFGANGLNYICLAGQSPVLQMPEQAFYVVAQAVACQLLSEDAAALPPAQRLLAMLEADLYGGANDRDDAEPDSAANETFA